MCIRDSFKCRWNGEKERIGIRRSVEKILENLDIDYGTPPITRGVKRAESFLERYGDKIKIIVKE